MANITKYPIILPDTWESAQCLSSSLHAGPPQALEFVLLSILCSRGCCCLCENTYQNPTLMGQFPGAALTRYHTDSWCLRAPEMYHLPVLEAGSLRSSCWPGQARLKAPGRTCSRCLSELPGVPWLVEASLPPSLAVLLLCPSAPSHRVPSMRTPVTSAWARPVSE